MDIMTRTGKLLVLLLPILLQNSFGKISMFFFVQYFFCKKFENNLITLSYITAPLKVFGRDF